MNSETIKLDKEYIINRVSNWKERLKALFSNINSWSNEFTEDIKIKQLNIPQAREELMYKFNIEPQNIPSLVLSSNNNRVSFIPLGLWVIGSNGRVNISTKKNQYILLDLGESNKQVKWTIVNPLKRKETVLFDSQVLKKLIKDENIFI